MLFPGTEMHIIVFCFILIEVIAFIVALIFFLSRPKEKSTKWYLILLFLLIQYNLLGGLLPDESFPISERLQIILAYTGGVITPMYFPFYFYKAFELKELKKYALKGVLYFILLPFIVTFVIPFFFIGNLDLSRQLLVIIPFVFSIAFFIALKKSIQAKLKTEKEKTSKELIIGMYISAFLWCAMPLIVLFEGNQLLEHSLTNSGFLVISLVYVRSIILNSRKEHEQLLKSKLTEQQLNTFINFAHEIKTPLTLINNYLDEYNSKFGRNEDMEVINLHLHKLTRDILNFFDLEKLNKGFANYNNNQIINFSEFLSSNITLFQPTAHKKKINFAANIENELYAKVSPVALNSIIKNLIDNAMKYTDKGGKIEVCLNRVGETIVFSVKDNGIGISEATQESIFQPYYQIKTQKRNTDGMGLGLPIVRKLIEMLNWEIKLESIESKGSLFQVILPFKSYSEHEIEQHIPLPAYEEIYQPDDSIQIEDVINPESEFHILVVEDNLEMLNYLISKLGVNYNVYAATGGAMALQKLNSLGKVDLIISDLMMDEMNGIDFLREISNDNRFSYISFIFLTANTTEKSKTEALSLGAIDYIQKPFNIKELKYKIESILNNQQKQLTAFGESLIRNTQKEIGLQVRPLSSGNHIGNQQSEFIRNCKKFNLTAKEIEICTLISKGLSYKEIADELSRSERTVQSHAKKIFDKVCVNNKLGLLNELGFKMGSVG
ncbi:ATP-binding protein [Flexithrix dorotheae]|uniref:ATP-binding protein n=1 Tax=Flexithrix dorotheae TaxID=70993 RepID=UPI00037CD926|nr:ATP-binding protein [Flexithrix dorotheae]